MNSIFSSSTHSVSTMSFVLKKALSEKSIDLPLAQVQSMVASMLNFPSFESLKATEAKAKAASTLEVIAPVADRKAAVLSCDNPESGADCWILEPTSNRVYIEVGPSVVHIQRNHEGVIVDVFALKSVMADTLASTYSYHVDAFTEALKADIDTDLIELAAKFHVDIQGDCDQPGLFVWIDKTTGEGCGQLFESVNAAFENAIDTMLSNLSGQVAIADALEFGEAA